MPALGSNQLLVLMLSGLLLASGAALVVAENPSDANSDVLGDQTKETPASKDRNTRDPNSDIDPDRYGTGEDKGKDIDCDDDQNDHYDDVDEGEGVDKNGKFDWYEGQKASSDRKPTGEDGDDTRPNDRPGNERPQRERPDCDTTDLGCEREGQDPGDSDTDRQRRSDCERLRERMRQRMLDQDRAPNSSPDGDERPDRDGRPQHDSQLWVTTAVVDGGVLILAGGPNGPLSGVALWVDDLPRPFVTNDQGWFWMDDIRDGCHVVKALYQPGDRWFSAQTKFCFKERPDEPDPPQARMQIKVELLDRENDGFTEVVLIHVYGPDGAPLEGAKVMIDRERAGVTGPKGLADFRIARGGGHWAKVTYGDMVVEREFKVEPRDDDPDPEPRHGVIEGVVYGTDDNVEWRLAGALVQLRPADNWEQEYARAETGEHGTFRFGDVPAGKWELRVSHEDYNVAEVMVEVISGQAVEVTILLEQKETEPEPPAAPINVRQVVIPNDEGVLNQVHFGASRADDAMAGVGIVVYSGEYEITELHTGDEGWVSAGILYDGTYTWKAFAGGEQVDGGGFVIGTEVQAYAVLQNQDEDESWNDLQVHAYTYGEDGYVGQGQMLVRVFNANEQVVRYGHTDGEGVWITKDLHAGLHYYTVFNGQNSVLNHGRFMVFPENEPEPEPPHMWLEVEQSSSGVHAIVRVGNHRVHGADVKLDGTYVGKTNDDGVIFLGQPEAGEHKVSARWVSPYDVVYEAMVEFVVEGEPEPEPAWVFTVTAQGAYVHFEVKDHEGHGINEAPIYLGDALKGHTNERGFFYLTNLEPGTYTAVTVDPDGNEYVATFVIEDPDPPAPAISFTAQVFAGGQDGVSDDVKLRVFNDNGHGIDNVAVHIGEHIVGYTNVYGFLYLYDMDDGRYGAWVTVEDITEDVGWVIET